MLQRSFHKDNYCTPIKVNFKFKDILKTTTVILVLILFMYTGVSKLIEYNKFVFQMQRVPLPLIQNLAPTLGGVVPIIEIALVIMLYFEKSRFLGLIGSLTLLVSFETYIIWMKSLEVQLGIRLPCTCGGIISSMGWTEHLLFNAIFIILLALSTYFDWTNRTQNRTKNVYK